MELKRTYAGIPEEYASSEKSKVVLIPVAYDGTSTWGKGADKGPEAFLEASENMELYDIETDSEAYREGIYLTETLKDFDSPETMVDSVHAVVKDFINRRKMVTMIGGEHSVSIGAIRAFNETYQGLTVLQIDAHADLRASYNGSKYNHACALYEASQITNLVQVGIRSMDRSENSIMNRDHVFFAHEIITDDYWMDNVLDLMTENVYITFDLDALDPSILSSTGTPEPGGLFWYETLEFLKRIFEECNVVGFDIVELCPNGMDKCSDFLVAKLYYKMLSYKYRTDVEEDADEYDQLHSFEKFESNGEQYDES
ncbi:MAG: agmatinase [Maribacter sp.]|nr:agmatinase [Maribacter sp.]